MQTILSGISEFPETGILSWTGSILDAAIAALIVLFFVWLREIIKRRRWRKNNPVSDIQLLRPKPTWLNHDDEELLSLFDADADAEKQADRHEKHWTPGEARTLAVMSDQGVSYHAIAAVLKRTERACSDMLHDLIHGLRPDLCIYTATRQALARLREKTGVSRKEVCNAMREYWESHLDNVPDHALPTIIDKLVGGSDIFQARRFDELTPEAEESHAG